MQCRHRIVILIIITSCQHCNFERLNHLFFACVSCEVSADVVFVVCWLLLFPHIHIAFVFYIAKAYSVQQAKRKYLISVCLCAGCTAHSSDELVNVRRRLLGKYLLLLWLGNANGCRRSSIGNNDIISRWETRPMCLCALSQADDLDTRKINCPFVFYFHIDWQIIEFIILSAGRCSLRTHTHTHSPLFRYGTVRRHQCYIITWHIIGNHVAPNMLTTIRTECNPHAPRIESKTAAGWERERRRMYYNREPDLVLKMIEHPL